MYIKNGLSSNLCSL